MEEKKHKVSVITIVLLTLVILILAAIAVIYFYKYIPGLNNKGNTNHTENNSTQNTTKILAVDDELVTKLYKYIPVSSTVFEKFDYGTEKLKSAYQNKLVKYSDMSNILILETAYQNMNELISFDEENIETKTKGDRTYVSNSGYFSKDIMDTKIKELYGSEATVVHQDFNMFLYYNEGTYYKIIGGFEGVYSYYCVSNYISKAYIVGDELYIYDKCIYAHVNPTELPEGDSQNEYDNYVYSYKTYTDSTLNNLIDSFKSEKELTNDELKTKYKDKMKTYKHTFKKDASGNYYWYSSEPVNE